DPGPFGEFWAIPAGGPVISSPAVIKGFDPQPDPPGKVLFTSLDGYLYVADGRSGRLLGKISIGPASAPPLVTYGVPDTKIIAGAGNLLLAFDTRGHRLWST